MSWLLFQYGVLGMKDFSVTGRVALWQYSDSISRTRTWDLKNALVFIIRNVIMYILYHIYKHNVTMLSQVKGS